MFFCPLLSFSRFFLLSLVNRFLPSPVFSFFPSSFLVASFVRTFVSTFIRPRYRRIDLASSLRIRVPGVSTNSIESGTKLQGTRLDGSSFFLFFFLFSFSPFCRCPSRSMKIQRGTILCVDFNHLASPRPICFLRHIIFFFFVSLSLFLFAKTERAALENRIDTACKNKVKMSGDAGAPANKVALPVKMASSIHRRALIRGEFSLSFTAARKQRQHDFHE